MATPPKVLPAGKQQVHQTINQTRMDVTLGVRHDHYFNIHEPFYTAFYVSLGFMCSQLVILIPVAILLVLLAIPMMIGGG